MDYISFDRPKLWLNVAGFVFCCAAAAYLLYEGRTGRHDLTAVLLFLIFAINSLFRIFVYFKLERIRKSAASVEEIVHAEHRQGLIVSIFSNAMFLLFLLLLFIEYMIEPRLPAGWVILFAVFVLMLVWTLVLSIRNLKRFDKSVKN